MAGNNGNLNLALTIQPYLNGAVESLREVKTGLQDIDNAGQAAGKSTSHIADDQELARLTGELDRVGEAVQGLGQSGESAEAAAARIREMVRASLEYKQALDAQLQASVEEAAVNERSTAISAERAQAIREAAAAAYASQQQVTAQMRSIGELTQRVEAGASSFEELAETEQMLDRAMRAGLISEEDQAEALEKLSAQEKKLVAEGNKLSQAREQQAKQMQRLLQTYDPASSALERLEADERKLTQAMEAGRISRERYNRAMAAIQNQRSQWTAVQEGATKSTTAMRGLNIESLAVQRNLSQLVTYSVSGQWQMAGRQLLQLGNRAGTTGALLSGMGISIGVVAAGAGLMAVSLYRGYMQMRDFEQSLTSTGRVAGVTAGALADMRNEIGGQAGAYSDAQAALSKLAASGKYSADSLREAAAAAVNLAELTGDSIESTTQQIIALADSPTEAMLKLNDRYHFLTLEVYRNVRALEDQGRAQEAAKLVTEELARVTEQRVSEMEDRAGTLEKKWHQVRNAIRGVIQELKDMGRTDSDRNLQLIGNHRARLQSVLKHVEDGGYIGFGSNIGASFGTNDRGELKRRIQAELVQLQAQTDELNKQKEVLEEQAEASARSQKEQDEAIKARAAIDSQMASIDKRAERQQRLNRLVEQYNRIAAVDENDPRLYDGSFDRLKQKIIKDTTEQRSSRKKKTDEQKAEEAAQREIDNLVRQVAMLGTLEDGQKKATEAARVYYEVTQGAYRDASAALKEQLLDQAQLLDSEQRRIEANRQLLDVHAQIRRLQGGADDPKFAEETRNLRQLQQYFDNLGRAAEAADVSKLLNLRQVSEDLKTLQTDYDRVMGQIAMEQQRIQIEQQSGLITETAAQERVVGLYRDKLTILRELVPQMRAAAEALGDPRALANVEQIELKLQEMAAVTDRMQQAFNSTFSSAFSTSLMSVVTATNSLTEAVQGFFVSLAQGMAEFIAKDWAQQLANWATEKLFSQGVDAVAETASETAAATTAAAAAAPILGGSIVSGATGGAGIFTSALEAAFIAGAAQIASAISTSSAVSSVASFDTSGYTGPGTKYQPAGIVHAGEFVHRAAVVRQPGAMAFLHAFNRYGMTALWDWHRKIPGYADGGLVSLRPAPRIGMTDTAKTIAPEVHNDNRLRIINQIDPNAVGAGLARAGIFEREIRNFISMNPNYIREQLSS